MCGGRGETSRILVHFALSFLLKTSKRVGFRAVILAPTRELAQQVGLERGEGWDIVMGMVHVLLD